MGASLEVRVPILDHNVVDFSWSLPEEWKLKNNTGKYIFKDVLYQYVPKSLIDRPKMGFGIPIGDWMRGPLKEWVFDLLNEQRIREQGYLNPNIVSRILKEHMSGDVNWQYQLWDIVVFQAWNERWN